VRRQRAGQRYVKLDRMLLQFTDLMYFVL